MKCPFKEIFISRFISLQKDFKDIYYLIFNKKLMIGQIHLV